MSTKIQVKNRNLLDFLIDYSKNPELNSSNYFDRYVQDVILQDAVTDMIEVIEKQSITDKSVNNTLTVAPFCSNNFNKINILSQENRDYIKTLNKFKDPLKVFLGFMKHSLNKMGDTHLELFKSQHSSKLYSSKVIYNQLYDKGICKEQKELIDIQRLTGTFELGMTAGRFFKTETNDEVSIMDIIRSAKIMEIYKKLYDPDLFGIFIYDKARQLYSISARFRPTEQFTDRDIKFKSEFGNMYGSMGITFPMKKEEISKDFYYLHECCKQYVCP